MLDDIVSDENFDFEKAFNESLREIEENTIITAKVLNIDNDTVFLNFGYKAEAKVLVTEFDVLPQIGDEIEVYLIRLEGRTGEPIVSKKRVDYINEKKEIENACREREPVKGIVIEVTSGGCLVAYKNVKGFIPNSMFDPDRNTDIKRFLNKEVSFFIERLEYRHNPKTKKTEEFIGNRRRYISQENNISRTNFFNEKKEGDIIEGTVKTITDFGAFIDLGGIDALLHIKDISWVRINNVTDVVNKGDTLKVQVLSIDHEKKKIGVGLKQLQDDPWDKFVEKYNINDVVVGTVESITTYGAFVKIIEGVEGLLHVSDLSWMKKIKNPTELVAVGQKLEVKIINIDNKNRRISLSLKHLLDNPWEKAGEKYSVGKKVKGKIKTITTFGVFVELEEGIEALLHIDDISWTEKIRNPHKHFKVGDEFEAVVIQSDIKKMRIKIGIKQLEDDPWRMIKENYKNGDIIKCKILNVDPEKGLEVEISDNVNSHIPISHISSAKREEISSTLTESYKAGDEIEAMVTSINIDARRISLSIRECLKKKEREKVETFLIKEEEEPKYTLGEALKAKEKNK